MATERQCRVCGETKPLTEFLAGGASPVKHCKACHRERNYRWAREHPERLKALSKKSNLKHADRVKAARMAYALRVDSPERRAILRRKSVRWREKNREKHRAYSRQYSREHPELNRAHRRTWIAKEENRERERERLRLYKRENREKYSEYRQRRRARMRSCRVGKVDYAVIWKRDAGVCHICRLPVERRECHFDHVVPVGKGGPHSMENIKVAHAQCNMHKNAKILPHLITMAAS